jgi:hypothetical protein
MTLSEIGSLLYAVFEDDGIDSLDRACMVDVYRQSPLHPENQPYLTTRRKGRKVFAGRKGLQVLPALRFAIPDSAEFDASPR